MIEDLPVAVALPPPLGTDVALWIERDLGWQVVDRDGPLEPVIALSDRECGPSPWIAVTDGAPDGEQVRRHLTAGALDVVAWPHDRLRIPLLAAQAERDRGADDHRGRLTIAGAAGGVGTSTVALAIGGLLAWSGAAVLVSGGADLLTFTGGGRPGAGPQPVAVRRFAGEQMRPGAEGGRLLAADAVGGAVAAPDAALTADTAAVSAGATVIAPGAAVVAPGATVPNRSAPIPVPGVPRLSVVGDGVDVATAAWSGDIVVVDGGTARTAETTLIVSRPDRSLERARAAGLPVILVGDGPLGPRDCRRVLGAALLAHLPSSSRVARAGLYGRLPAGLPGAWLRDLRAGLARLERRS